MAQGYKRVTINAMVGSVGSILLVRTDFYLSIFSFLCLWSVVSRQSAALSSATMKSTNMKIYVKQEVNEYGFLVHI